MVVKHQTGVFCTGLKHPHFDGFPRESSLVKVGQGKIVFPATLTGLTGRLMALYRRLCHGVGKPESASLPLFAILSHC
jgi:hypothetical protein